MSTFPILLVADDPLARAGLSGLLASHAQLQVLAQLASADILGDEDGDSEEIETAVAIIWDLGWDFDDALPPWDALPLPIIALKPADSDTTALWRSGVRGVLSRQASADQIATAVQAVVLGLGVFDGETAVLATAPTPPEMVEELTPREQDVLQLLAEGLTNKAIGQQLEISNHTVKFHVNAIMSKLNAQSRTDAVVRATRLGLIVL